MWKKKEPGKGVQDWSGHKIKNKKSEGHSLSHLWKGIGTSMVGVRELPYVNRTDKDKTEKLLWLMPILIFPLGWLRNVSFASSLSNANGDKTNSC